MADRECLDCRRDRFGGNGSGVDAQVGSEPRARKLYRSFSGTFKLDQIHPLETFEVSGSFLRFNGQLARHEADKNLRRGGSDTMMDLLYLIEDVYFVCHLDKFL